MNEFIAQWLPTIVEVITVLGSLIGILKKFGNLDNVDKMNNDIKYLRKQNAQLKEDLAEIKESCKSIVRRQKGIKDENINSGNRK